MSNFFDDYFNIAKIWNAKREYKRQMKRVQALPKDYQVVYKKIEKNMWHFVSGAGYDMLEIQYGLIDLFEQGAASGKKALEITGDDVATFVKELLKNTRNRTDDWKTQLNEDIKRELAGL